MWRALQLCRHLCTQSSAAAAERMSRRISSSSSSSSDTKDARLAGSARLMLRRLEAAPSREDRSNVMRSRMGLMRNRNFWKPLIQTLQKKAKNKLLCVEVFDWIRHEVPDVAKAQIYANMIAYAGSIRRPQLAHAWVSEMKLKGIKMSTSTYNALVSVLCRNGEVEAAVTTLEKMKWADCPPNISTYNTILAAYGRSLQITEMNNWLAEYSKAGLKPNVVTYNTQLFSYLNKGRLQKVEEIRSEMMVEVGCQPDFFTFGILLHGYLRLNLVDKMEAAFLQMQKLGVPVGSVAAQRMIQAYLRNGMFHKVKMVTSVLEAGPGRVYTTRLNSLILECFVKAGDVGALESQMWRIVKQRKAFVDPEVLDEVVLRLGDKFDSLYKAIKENPRWRLHVSTFELLIRERAKRDDYKKVVEVAEDMELAGWQWSVDIMEVLYKVFKQAGDKARLILIVEKMEKL